MKITIEQKLKEIGARKRPTSDDIAWLIKELKSHRKTLNKICSDYWCNLDTFLDKDSPFKDRKCPTCLANAALVKKVKK